MLELKDTVEGMLSSDYKERFVAEYVQTAVRFCKLKNMLTKHMAGELEFIPTCPIQLLVSQRAHMRKYLNDLIIRAKIEGIELPIVDDEIDEHTLI